MEWQFLFGSIALAASVMLGSANRVAAQYAVEVISYLPGTTPAAGFIDPSAPLGEPERFTGEGVFPGAVSPFNPPFLNTEIISVGEGGGLTLRLSNFVLPQGGPEIGVFTNAGLADDAYPNGQAAATLNAGSGTFGIDRAEVEVSEDGLTWESLGLTTFDVPTNGYTDLTSPFSSTAGSSLTDLQQPFAGSLSDFENLFYSDGGNPDILDLLAGSGGGTWLDISGTSFSQVGYIRFSVADDGDPMTSLNFELDAVSIASGAIGAATVPEPSTFVLVGLMGIAACLATRCRLSRVHSDA